CRIQMSEKPSEIILSPKALELQKFLANYQPLDKHRRNDAINAARREALEYASDLRSARSPEDRKIFTRHVIRLSTIYTYLTGKNLDLNGM
ncbi:MAG: hypothetical protein ACK53L_14875, partial [Pirellulaceae bacterium]